MTDYELQQYRYCYTYNDIEVTFKQAIDQQIKNKTFEKLRANFDEADAYQADRERLIYWLQDHDKTWGWLASQQIVQHMYKISKIQQLYKNLDLYKMIKHIDREYPAVGLGLFKGIYKAVFEEPFLNINGRPKSQKQRIIDYLRTGGTLTIFNAPKEVNIYHQLARGVFYAKRDLIKEKLTIKSTKVRTLHYTYVRYTLEKLNFK